MRIPKEREREREGVIYIYTLLESFELQLVSASHHPALPWDLVDQLRITRSLEERLRRIGRYRFFEMHCPFFLCSSRLDYRLVGELGELERGSRQVRRGGYLILSQGFFCLA